jgi:diadenosine tetraphosphate (Ap4A) HIT family hydrolase
MSNRESSEAVVFADGMFSLEPSAECLVPGYLVLRVKGPETSLAELAPPAARALGELLARAAAAIEQAVKPDRVYVLSFCEVDRRLHFHLFPRSAWLLGEYGKANDRAGDRVDGPALFAWARSAFGPGSRIPEGLPDSGSVCGIIRGILE